MKNKSLSKPSKGKTGLAGKENIKLDSNKKSRLDTRSHSKGFKSVKLFSHQSDENIRRRLADGRKVM